MNSTVTFHDISFLNGSGFVILVFIPTNNLNNTKKESII